MVEIKTVIEFEPNWDQTRTIIVVARRNTCKTTYGVELIQSWRSYHRAQKSPAPILGHELHLVGGCERDREIYHQQAGVTTYSMWPRDAFSTSMQMLKDHVFKRPEERSKTVPICYIIESDVSPSCLVQTPAFAYLWRNAGHFGLTFIVLLEERDPNLGEVKCLEDAERRATEYRDMKKFLNTFGTDETDVIAVEHFDKLFRPHTFVEPLERIYLAHHLGPHELWVRSQHRGETVSVRRAKQNLSTKNDQEDATTADSVDLLLLMEHAGSKGSG